MVLTWEVGKGAVCLDVSATLVEETRPNKTFQNSVCMTSHIYFETTCDRFLSGSVLSCTV